MADYDLTKEEDVKLYLQNIETEYRYQCQYENQPDGCHRLGDYLCTIKQVVDEGVKFFKSNCEENKYSESCFKYAQHLTRGKGVDADPVDGLRYFELACEYGFGRGCSVAGMQNIRGKGITKDRKKGLHYLDKACSMGRGETCATIGTMHLLGKYGTAKDAVKAISYLEKGCEMGSEMGCFNLAKMYHNGDGVQRNDPLANKYQDLANKIRRANDGTTAPSVSLGRTS